MAGWKETGMPRPLPVQIFVEFVICEKVFIRLRSRAPGPHDETLAETGRKPADGRRRVVLKPTPWPRASAVVRATWQPERGHKRSRQPAISTPASRRRQRR